jgi:hypothetical protein
VRTGDEIRRRYFGGLILFESKLQYIIFNEVRAQGTYVDTKKVVCTKTYAADCHIQDVSASYSCLSSISTFPNHEV